MGLLVLVSRNPGISQTALAGAVGIERSTLGEAVDRLAKRGLLVREAAPNDRRSLALRLSASGENFIEGLIPRMLAHEDAVPMHLTPKARDTLMILLRRLTDEDQNGS